MTQPGNILPHNPLTVAGVLDELKKLKGNKPWTQFELELLCKQYPDNATFKVALDKITSKAKTVQPEPAKQASKSQATESSKKKNRPTT